MDMRLLLAAVLLLPGFVAPAVAQPGYPANAIEWRPADEGVAWGPVWGYDPEGDIACPSFDGLSCVIGRDIATARSVTHTLSCGAQMRAHFGYSGYDTEGHWCRELALRHGNQHGVRWRAPAHGVNFYWRLNPASGEVECASDGANCFWWTPSLEEAFKGTNAVGCQAGDYTKPGHWCNSLAGERRGNGFEWRAHYRVHFTRPIETAVEDMYFSYGTTGDIQCPSHDGRTCFWPKSVAEAQSAKQVLACGADLLAKHGINGYDTPGHWCRTIALAEGNAKGFAYQWGLHGLLNAREVMCASTDGVNCHWGAPLSESFKDANPLICGIDHASRYGDVGYGTAGNWCAQFAAVRGNAIWIQNRSGLPVRVCRAVPFQPSEDNNTFADIRCTDLAAGTALSAAITVVRVLPFVAEGMFLYHYRAVCVEAQGGVGFFLGPVVGETGEIVIGSAIKGDETLLGLSRSFANCREAFAFI